MTKKPRARKAKRAALRAATKRMADAKKLAALSPGGTPSQALTVDSAAVIASRASDTRCLFCDGGLRLLDHRVEMHEGTSFRAVDLRCSLCGLARTLYFRIAAPLLN